MAQGQAGALLASRTVDGCLGDDGDVQIATHPDLESAW